MPVPDNTLIFNDRGEKIILRNALYSTGTPARNWTIRLFKNDFTPDETFVTSDLTTADFTGYNPVALGAWTDPTTVANVALSAHGQVTFACGSSGITSNNIYGWYLTDDDDSDEAFACCRMVAVPVLMFAPLQELKITPYVSLRTLGS